MRGLKKVFSLIFNSKKKEIKNNNHKELASKIMNYFIELEHFNFMNCDKESLSLFNLKNYFHKEPTIDYFDFIRPNGSPQNYMQIFLQKKRESAKGK